MIGIVIVAHGGLAKEYLAAVEHVVGNQPGITAVSVAAECDRPGKVTEIKQAIEMTDKGEGVVVVTDMFGGSPSNLARRACHPNEDCLLFGANLPMLIQLAKSRKQPIPEAIETALTAGRKYMNSLEAQKQGKV